MSDEAADPAGDQSEHSVRTWLVERSYDDRGLVGLVYATPDGERQLRREVSMHVLRRSPATAARDVDPADLEPVPDGSRERYAEEAARVSEANDPDVEI